MDSSKLDNLDLTIPESTPTVIGEPNLEKPHVYTVSENDIEFLKKQISITTEQATELLQKNNGNYVNAIINFYQVNYKTQDVIGIAQPSITMLPLEEKQVNAHSVNGRKMTYDLLSSSTVNTLSKTYLFVTTNPGYSGFTKKKKYCTLKELIDTEYIPNITIELMQSLSCITIHELVGHSNEILEKWSMPSSAIVLCPEQIVSNQYIVEQQLFNKLNKVATQIARHSGIIQESESILHIAYVIGNVDFC